MTRHPEIGIYITGLAVPLDDQQIIRLGESIEILKNGMGITLLSNAFDCIWLLNGAQREASRKNLVKDAHHLSEINTLSFTANDGFTNAGTGYFDTNYNPATQAVRLTQDSASIGYYSKTSTNQSGTKDAMSIIHAEVAHLALTPVVSTGGIYYYINTLTDNVQSYNNQNDGLFSGVRNNATQNQIYRNKTAATIRTANSTGLPNGNMYIMAGNQVGAGARSHWIGKMSFAYIGRGMSQSDINAINDFYTHYAFFLI